MRNDFEMVEFSLPKDVQYANIYPLGDLHLGSRECDLELFLLWRETVLNDPNGYVVIIGDLLDWGLKNSKTNIYEAVMTPLEQKEYLFDLLKPIKHRIVGIVPGNHEYRGVKEVGTCPLYDVACRLGIEDVYRPNMCVVKFGIGNQRGKNVVYGITLHHGASKNKFAKFCESMDGINLFISGHTHETDFTPKAKTVCDLRHRSIRVEPYLKVVVPPFQKYGGYAIRGAYTPSAIGQFPHIRLDGMTKHIGYTYQ